MPNNMITANTNSITANTGTFGTLVYSPSIIDIMAQVDTSKKTAEANQLVRPAEPPRSTWVNPYRHVFTLRNWYEYDRDMHRRKVYNVYNTHYDGQEMVERADDLVRAICNVAQSLDFYDAYGRMRERDQHITPEDARMHRWFLREINYHKMHRAVLEAIKVCPPRDLHALVLEWPHQANTDPSRIAYTRSEDHGRADRQTLTSVGKYLRQHFPTMTDSQLRDIVMRHGAHTFALWDTTHDIIKSVQHGPQSCMKWSDYDAGEDWENHPYNVYDPALGWRAAVRLDGSKQIVGRCLVNISGDSAYDYDKVFVRSYAHREVGYSHSDEALEVWLRDHGFVKVDDWNGCRMRYIPTRYNFLAPYLDGDNKRVDVDETTKTVYVTNDGRYTLESTEGRPCNCGAHCPDCDEYYDSEDMVTVGYHNENEVCRHCVQNSYRYVLGRGRTHYYLHEDDAVFSEYTDEWYDREYLRTNGMVELDNGDICPEDEVVYLASRDIWVHSNDEVARYCDRENEYEHEDDCVELADGTWTHKDNAWECEASGDWYHDDDADEQVELCDMRSQYAMVVHADKLEEYYDVDLDDVADACDNLTTETN